jgi:hypothetical protein
LGALFLKKSLKPRPEPESVGPIARPTCGRYGTEEFLQIKGAAIVG